MELDEESKLYCCLNTHLGIYKMNRLPYGVSSAPAIFQREMDRLLRDIPGVKCLLDDVLITGTNKEEALYRLHQVLSRIKNAGLKLKKSKCKFMQKSVKYLGYVLTTEGIKPDEEKIKPIINAVKPVNIHELRSFLGAVTFYARFINNLSKIASPLN